MQNETSQYDSFSEKSKLIDIALKYTNGDMEKAKLMTSGMYNDVEVIKGKFAINRQNIYGIFFIFINIPNKYIMNINVLLLSNNNIYSKSNIFDNWKSFYIDFREYARREDENAINSHDFTNHLIHSLKGYNAFVDIEEENLENLTEIIKEIISKYYKLEEIDCQIALEKSNSLNLELKGIPVELPSGMEDIKELEDIVTKEDKRISEIEAQADYIIEGRVIISPIKGRYIYDLKIGEKIKILLANHDEKSKSIAKRLNALSEDEEILPINARVKEKIPLESGGFLIYGLIAKNVLVKIIEEENIKIEVDSHQLSSTTSKTADSKVAKIDSTGRLLIYLILLIGLILSILLIALIIS